MSVKMEVKLNEEQVKELLRPVSREELAEKGVSFQEYSKERREDIVSEIALNSGFHPLGYGMWSIGIIKKGDDYYATWHRSETCD